MNVHSIAWFRSKYSGYESEKAGTSQGIFFANFIECLVKAHEVVWPDWELRVYHDDRVIDFPEFNLLASSPAKLIYMGKCEKYTDAMLWRMLPVFDPDVDWFICRDVDSLPMHRDRVMVEEAMASGAKAHAILDSESHCGPYLGGMIGFHAPTLRETFPDIHDLKQFLALDTTVGHLTHGDDQRFLNRIVWPKLMKKTLIHQRRPDVQYPEAMMTKPAAPCVTALDKIVHIGAAYPREKATEALK